MKRCDCIIVSGSQLTVEMREVSSGAWVPHQDAAAIEHQRDRAITQRDNLAKVVNNWIIACDGPEFAVLRAASRIALDKLDKEKQS